MEEACLELEKSEEERQALKEQLAAVKDLLDEASAAREGATQELEKSEGERDALNEQLLATKNLLEEETSAKQEAPRRLSYLFQLSC